MNTIFHIDLMVTEIVLVDGDESKIDIINHRLKGEDDNGYIQIVTVPRKGEFISIETTDGQTKNLKINIINWYDTFTTVELVCYDYQNEILKNKYV